MVLSNIGGPGCAAEEEPLHGNNVHCIDPVDSIHIRSCKPAAGEGSSDIEEMPLDGDDIHGGDPRGAWRPSGVGWRHSIVTEGG